MGTTNGLGGVRGAPASARLVLGASTGILAALVLAPPLTPVIAQAVDPTAAGVTGVVYRDSNGNGQRDAGEPGIPDVSVSDGARTVQTDDQGGYSLDVDVDRRITDIIYLSKPAGYAVATDEFKTPQFYRTLGELADGASVEADFALRPDPNLRQGDFTFANVADTHVNPNVAAQLQQINDTAQDLAFVQISGDLTNNATDAEFESYLRSTAASALPVWPAVGNHEYFNGGEPTYPARIDNYRRHVGPEWYSFGYGDRHFVVLENNGAAPFEEQHAWLLQDLQTHAEDKRVVVLMHQPMNVPFGSPTAYDAFQQLFESYDTELVLVGHEHSNQADLTWVKGARHVQTNSSSYTIDHSPRGFRYVHMRGKGSDNPFRMYGVDRALTVTNPGPDSEVSARALKEIQVNAYHTADEVRQVRYRLDGGGQWRDLARSGDFTWYGGYPSSARSPGKHRVDVEAVASGGARWKTTTTYTVTDAAPPTIQAGADWPQFHGDPSHSGVASEVLAPGLDLAWTYRTPGAILTGSPVIAGGIAYVGTRDENDVKTNAVHAVDMTTGKRVWSARTDASVHGTPAVADGLVFVPTLNATLYAFDAKTGALRWKREAEAADPPAIQRKYSYYSPAVADGKVYWPYQTRHGAASRGLLAALDTKTGTPVWESPMTGATMSDGTPAVADGRVYVGNETADRVIAYDAATGQQLWVATARLGGWQDGTPMVAGNRLFIGSNNGLIARDATTGADLWTYRSPGPSFIPQNATPATPAVVEDTAYVGFPDGRVTALDVSTGAVVWSVLLPGKPYLGGVLSAPAVSGDTVYVGSNGGHVYALDRATGSEQWSYEIGTWVASGPAISGNALLVGAWDGNLYAFAARK
ncbi:PQQ-binding-like beta-propeller repeat protein [Actinopolymorpha sp. B17G11]|uniref:outer membrane protein assembly factor BamB family protein n=1 Tax=Actinopolymorpha sp. B17G11 TaxID=3160861 RepID=UPI0032E43B3B